MLARYLNAQKGMKINKEIQEKIKVLADKKGITPTALLGMILRDAIKKLEKDQEELDNVRRDDEQT